MENTTITVSRNTRNDLMLFKIQTNAKNLDEVIKLVIKKLKNEVKNGDNTNIRKKK